MEVLARPRRWARLMSWSDAFGFNEAFLRQVVAAAEEFGLVESVQHGGRMVWRLKVERERDWAAPSTAS